MKKWKIHWMTKLLIPLLCLGMLVGTVVVVLSFRDMSMRSGQMALKQLEDTTYTIQLTLEKELQSCVQSLKTLKNIIQDKPVIGEHEEEVIVNGLRMMLKEFPQLYGAWTIVEPEGVVHPDHQKNTGMHDSEGRFVPYLYDAKGEIEIQTMVTHTLQGVESSFYKIPLQTKAMYVTPPIEYEYKGELIDVISVCIPFDVGGEVRGVIGVDLELSRLTNYIASYKIYENGYAVLYDSEGTVIAHPESRFLRTNPYEEDKMIAKEKAAMDKTIATHTFSAVKARAGGDGVLAYKTFVPVFIDPTVEPYIVQVVVPLVEIFVPLRRLQLNILFVGMGLIIFLSFILQRLSVAHVRKMNAEINWKQYMSNK